MTTATNRNSRPATTQAATVSFTSESVTEGHPDKIADQISDAILDEALRIDPRSRVACETLLTTGLVVVAGEITSVAVLDYARIARRVIRDIGYTGSRFGFDADACAVITAVDRQSRDIKIGVDSGGAGDQGLMFGYACNETPELMPLPIRLAHRLTERLAEVRTSGLLPYLGPDGKSQVTVEYDGDRRPVLVSAVVVSSQHEEGIDQEELRRDIRREVIAAVLPPELAGDGTDVHINPTGSFVTGGPVGDTGLTGRKIIVDTYGGSGAHGGGAFSGKDPTKVDRSASYAARHIAKNVVAAGLAERCVVQLAYAIGVAEPVSVLVDTKGTGVVDDRRIAVAVRELFDLTPAGIIERLDLRRPIYRRTAAYGHFGRPGCDFTWERTDRVDELRREVLR